VKQEGPFGPFYGHVEVPVLPTSAPESTRENWRAKMFAMAIPSALEETWKYLWSEVVMLHAQWKIHEQLFGKGEKRLRLLNECASNFFFLVQQTFLLEIQLAICKLGDPPRSMGFDNLTLARLILEVKASDQDSGSKKAAKFYGRLGRRLEVFKGRSKNIRERRNKDLAHCDMATARMMPVHLGSPSRREITKALETLTRFMRDVERYFGEASTAYWSVSTMQDGDNLVGWLKSGRRFREIHEAGLVDMYDYSNSEWRDV
jgi:hypothetical protein